MGGDRGERNRTSGHRKEDRDIGLGVKRKTNRRNSQRTAGGAGTPPHMPEDSVLPGSPLLPSP